MEKIPEKGRFGRTLLRYPVITLCSVVILGYSLMSALERCACIPADYCRYGFAVLKEFTPFSFLLTEILLMYLLLHFTKWGRLLFLRVLFLISLFWPPLTSSDHYARSIACTSNMRQLQMGCIHYAGNHANCYPDSLETLLKKGYITPDLLRCPGNRWYNPGSVDYDYFGKGMILDEEDGNKILFQDKRPSNHTRRIIYGYSVLQKGMTAGGKAVWVN